jgi:aspartate aminotransferase
MPISSHIESMISKTSWIRKMFEEGVRRIKEYGAENVFDFSIGNPDFEPPAAVREALVKLAADPTPGTHRYMPNPGYPETRAFMAARLAQARGAPVTAAEVVMSVGAGGALNIVLRTLLDPGDEVLVIKPYFVDYLNYIANYNGIPKLVDSNPDFSLNP